MKQRYELMAIISPAITDAEIAARIKDIKELLGAEIVYEEHWGMRPFAYRIKKQSKGYYVVWNFMMEKDQIAELQHALQIASDVIRTLLQQVPENYQPMPLKEIEEGLSALAKAKSEKRFGGKPRVEKVLERKPLPPAEMRSEKIPEKAAAGPSEPPIPAQAPVPKEEVKKKSFDQKLEDILSDADLGL